MTAAAAAAGNAKGQDAGGGGGESKGKTFLYACSLFLRDVEVMGDGPQPEEVEASPTRMAHVLHAFHLLTGTQAWTVIAASDEERTAWTSLLTPLLPKRNVAK